MARTKGHFQPVFLTNLELEFKESNYSSIWTCILNTWRGQQTNERNTENIPFQTSSRCRIDNYFFGVSELWLYIPYARENSSNYKRAEARCRPRTEKEIFGIFGVINTMKITNGKSQWGSLLWFSLEIESFSFFFSFFCCFFFFFLFCFVLHTHRVHSWKQLV